MFAEVTGEKLEVRGAFCPPHLKNLYIYIYIYILSIVFS